MEWQACLWCSGNADDPEHWRTCDGRQGRVEDFDGETYDRDRDRLAAQLTRVRLVLSDHEWHTPAELEQVTGDSWASISARIRDLRKRKFGGRQVARRYVVDGLWAYRLVPADEVVTVEG